MRTMLLVIIMIIMANASDITQRYIIKINIKQEHFTLDLIQHLKDNANAIEVEIPVDKQFYNDVEIGTVLNDKFRTASLILTGSFGNWNVSIVDKKIINVVNTKSSFTY